MFSRKLNADPSRYRSRLLPLLLPAALATANLFLFMPASIYRGNADEFDVGLLAILRLYIVPALLLFSLLLAVGLLFPKKWVSLWMSSLCALGVLLWMQGNLLVWKYGLLNGQLFDWTVGSWRGFLDLSLWLAIMFGAILFHRRLHRFVPLIAASLLAVQSLTLPGVLATQPDEPNRGFRPPPPELAQFSSTNNVIQVVLDGFQSTLFEKVLNRDRPYYTQQLQGFTFLRDTVGAFPTTYMSIPAVLTGQVYRNELPAREYVRSVLNTKTLPNVLQDKGYEVDLIHTVGHYVSGKYTHAYVVPDPYTRNSEYHRKAKALLLLDLVLFREAPHFLKRFVYNDQAWLLQRKYSTVDSFQAISHMNFFNDFVKDMGIRGTKPMYKFIHLATTHSPVVFDERGEFTGRPRPWTEANHVPQAKIALEQFIQFLNRLKTLGIYDSSLIILQADHGCGHPVDVKSPDGKKLGDDFKRMVGNALPLLAIKPPHANAPLATSDAQVTLTDIPATVDAILGLSADFPGTSVFHVGPGENRVRAYAHYEWFHDNWLQEYLPPLQIYEIAGRAFDGASWKPKSVVSALDDSTPPTEVRFGTGETLRKHLRSGWGGNEYLKREKTGFNWALGPVAKMLVRLNRETTTRLRATIKPYPFNEPLNVRVIVDGTELGEWQVANTGNWQTRVIDIPRDPDGPVYSMIEFLFSKYLQNESIDERSLAVMFQSVAFESETERTARRSEFAQVKRIQFGTQETSSNYLLWGWGGNEITTNKRYTFNWAVGGSSAIQVHLPKERISLTASLIPFQFEKPQTITVKVDGNEVGKWHPENRWEIQTFVLGVPANSHRPDTSTIEFLFSQFRRPAGDQRPLAVMFESITLSKQ